MKTVQVVMSTYNGEKYLEEQINSILNQKDVNVSILVRDDGSSDKTLNILEKYKKKGQLEYYKGKNIGYGKSFLELLVRMNKADYYSFADQDDVWNKEKLIKAICKIESYNDEVKLYCSSLTYVDDKLKFIKEKDYSNLKISMGSALSRTRIAGCTMVFNNALLEKFLYSYQIKDVINNHDYLLYLLCLGCGGKIIFDNNSYIKYRRHGNNETSSGNGLKIRVKKELSRFNSKKNSKSILCKNIMNYYEDILENDSKLLIQAVIDYKKSWKNCIRLIFNLELVSGILSVDIYNRILMFFRCF